MNKHLGFAKSQRKYMQYASIIHWGFLLLMVVSIGLIDVGARVQNVRANQQEVL